jgi:hypothetical protein
MPYRPFSRSIGSDDTVPEPILFLTKSAKINNVLNLSNTYSFRYGDLKFADYEKKYVKTRTLM